MNVLNRFTIKNLKLNRKRTIVTIIGIMLSTALICGVAGLVSSFQTSLVNWARRYNGNYHATFHYISQDKLKYVKDNKKVEDYFLTGEIGWAELEGSQNEYKPYVYVREYDEKALNNYGLRLEEGRLPQNSDEIVISKHIITNGRVPLRVGDSITLNIGRRISETGEEIKGQIQLEKTVVEEEKGSFVSEHIADTKEKTYKIVGIVKRLNSEDYSSPGYTVITYMNEIPKNVDISVLYKNPKEYEEVTKDICKTFGIESLDEVDINADLLRFQGIMSESMLNVLYTIAGIIMVIIVVSSVFVIRNSFSISVAEKNKQYGMLASIGATAKQIKKSVIFEGVVIGLVAIPLGIVFGIVAIIILLQIVNYLLNDMLDGLSFVYSINLFAIIVSIAISFITIYLSCLIPARRASKISPIESIRGNNDIKIKAKKLKTSFFTKKIFGIGGVIASKNLKRSRKKYRTTVISIVVSIFIFISLSSFLSIGTKTSGVYYKDYKFNMYVENGTKDIYEELAKLENVDKYAYYYATGLEFDNMKYASQFGKEKFAGEFCGNSITLIAYNNEYFKEYLKELGVKEDYKKAVILIDEGEMFHNDGSRTIQRLYNVNTGDKIEVKLGEKEANIVITKCTDNKPMGQEMMYYTSGVIVVSEDFIKYTFNEEIDDTYSLSDLLIKSEKTEELENKIIDLRKYETKYSDLSVYNFETYMKQQNRMILVVKIFLYGFITVITLIGVTNIFNTITTNMILRSKEFAMLKSIGMSSKEFNKMIRLESIMYGTKSLLIGIPLGILGSYEIYKGFAQGIDLGYSLPYSAIAISIIFVFIIVGITMKYSLNKINKQNIIETIRNDNI